MDDVTGCQVDDLNERAQYGLLGQAWYAQCQPEAGEAYLIDSTVKIGKREFDALLPKLREDLRQPHFFGVAACVAATIRRHGTWPMPADVVATLVVQLGFGLSDRIITKIFGRHVLATATADDRFEFPPSMSDFSISTDGVNASNTYCTQLLTSEFESHAEASESNSQATGPGVPVTNASAAILLFIPRRKPEDDRLLS